MQNNLHRIQRKGIIFTMNTITEIINNINETINQNIIDDLLTLDFGIEDATKIVTQFEDFDLFADVENNPVNDF